MGNSPATHNELHEMALALEQWYTIDLQRPILTTHVDPLGSGVWIGEYQCLRMRGSGHQEAMTAVYGKVLAAAGVTSPVTDPTIPTWDQIRAWKGNFLAFPGYEYAFLYPAWSSSRQASFRSAYRQAGLTHLPLSIWAAYGGLEYDYRDAPGAFGELLAELLDGGLIPCVFLHTDAIRPPRYSYSSLLWFLERYIPAIAPSVPCWCLGWEFPQIDSGWEGWWTWDGTLQSSLARDVRALIGEAPLYIHFPPERITGRPHYAHDDPEGDEAQWWKDTPEIDGLLYQRAHDEPEDVFFQHTLGGNGDVGDAERIAGGYWGIHRDFVVFEHSRDYGRWQRIVDRVRLDPRVRGFC